MLDFAENNQGKCLHENTYFADTRAEVDSGKWIGTSSVIRFEILKQTKRKTIEPKKDFPSFPTKESSIPTTLEKELANEVPSNGISGGSYSYLCENLNKV